MGTVVHHIAFIDKEELDKRNNNELVKVLLYKDFSKEKIYVPKKLLRKIGFFVRGGDSLFGEGDISTIPSRCINFDSSHLPENGKRLPPSQSQPTSFFPPLPRRQRITNEFLSEFKKDGRHVSNHEHEKTLSNVLRNMTSFASYYSSLSLGNENNSLLKYRQIWTGFHLVVHSGDDESEGVVGADVNEAKKGTGTEIEKIKKKGGVAEEVSSTAHVFHRFCVKNSMGENVFNVYNSSKMSILINTNFDFLIFMYYYSKNLFHPRMKINQMPLLNFNWFVYILDFEKVSPLEVLRAYFVRKNASATSTVTEIGEKTLAAINYFIDCLKYEHFGPFVYGIEKMIFSEARCKRAIQESFRKLRTFCNSNILILDDIGREGNDVEKEEQEIEIDNEIIRQAEGEGSEGGGGGGKGERDEETEEGRMEWERWQEAFKSRKRKAPYRIVKKTFCEKHFGSRGGSGGSGGGGGVGGVGGGDYSTTVFERCPACFFEIFDDQILVGGFKLYDGVREMIKRCEANSSLRLDEDVQKMLDQLKSVKEKMILTKMEKILKMVNPRLSSENSVTLFFSKSMKLLFNDETCDYTKHLNSLLMRLINFNDRRNFDKSIFPFLNPFGKMIMLDMLNSTIVKEPKNFKDGRIICNYDTGVVTTEDLAGIEECAAAMAGRKYWSFSTINTHMTRQFQIYRWVTNRDSSSMLPFNVNNVQRIPVFECDPGGKEVKVDRLDFESYQAYGKLYLKNRVYPLSYFEEISLLKKVYNNATFKIIGNRLEIEREIKEKLIAADIVDYFSSKNEYGINYDVILNNVLGLENANIRTGNELYEICDDTSDGNHPPPSNDSFSEIQPFERGKKILCFVRNEEQETLLKNQSTLMASFFDTETTGLDAIVERMYSLAVCVRPVFEKDIRRVFIFVVAPYANNKVVVDDVNSFSKSKSNHSSFRDRIREKVLDLFRQKESLYGKVEDWKCFIFETEVKMLTAIDSFFYSHFDMFTYLVGFNVTFDLSFLLVRMVINNVDSKIFQLQKLTLSDKIDILKAYRASKSIIIRNSGGGGGGAEASSSSSSTGGSFNPNEKNYDRFLQILRAILIPEICFFDMQKMVRLKFSQLPSYNLNSCVENVCGKEQMEIEQKIIIDVRDLLNYFDDRDSGGNFSRRSIAESLEKAACIHAYCVHDAALVSLLESSLNTVMEQASLGKLTGKTFDTLIGWAPKGSKIVQACFEHDVKRKNENLVSITGYYDNHNNDQCSTKGGLVITPIQMSISDYGVITLDFASLYPSIMITNNCCPSTFVFHSQIVRAVDHRRGKCFLTPDPTFGKIGISNKSIEEAVDDEKAINVFIARTHFCKTIMKFWVPYNIIVENYNHEADKANARYLGVDYFPRHSFPSWIEEKGYWREDVQVQPTGLKYYFFLLYDLVDTEYDGKKELLESVFYPFGNLVKTVWDLGRLIAALLKKINDVADETSRVSFFLTSPASDLEDEGKEEKKKNINLSNVIESLKGERGGKKGIKRALDILHANETECPLIEEFVRGIASRCWDCGSYCRFWVCKYRLKDGCWPDLQLNLWEMRKNLKKKMKDKSLKPHERQLANIDQNNVKLMMNSAYGIMSGKYLKSSLNQLLSNLITGIGRRTTANIKIAANMLVDNLQNIYGDTDSTFSTIRNPCFRRRRVNDRFLDVDIKLEQDVCDFIEKNISRVLWGMKVDPDYLAGKNVMNLVPERMVLFGFLFRKKNYVLCHFNESPEVDHILKVINGKCVENDGVDDGSSGSGDTEGGGKDSQILQHCRILRNSNYVEEIGEEKLINNTNNQIKFRAKPSKYILRLEIPHLINMFLNSNFKTRNKNYAKSMLRNVEKGEREEIKEEAEEEIEDMDEESKAGMDFYKSLFQIYRKGIFCKGDINVLAMQLHYLTQISFAFKVDKNPVLRNLIYSILEFRDPYSKLSQYKKCSKPNPTSNYYQAMLEYNERTPSKYKIFTDLVLSVKSRYANMLCAETIEIAEDTSASDATGAKVDVADNDGGERKKLGKRKEKCSDFWLKRTFQAKKTWDNGRGIGTLSGRNILNKSAIVNVFILILDGLKVFKDAFGTMVEERIALSVGKRDFNGICFDINGKDNDNDNDNNAGGDSVFMEGHTFYPNDKEGEEENVESPASLHKVFPVFRKRKLSSIPDQAVNKRLKTRDDARDLKSFIDKIIDQENIEGVVKELKNCCPEIAEELFFAARSYAFYKTLCEMIKPNSAYMYCPNPICSQAHSVQLEKSDVNSSNKRVMTPGTNAPLLLSTTSPTLSLPSPSPSPPSPPSSSKRINCEEKKNIVFPNINDRICAIGLCEKLKSFKISPEGIFASLMEILTKHVRECNLFVGYGEKEMVVTILKLCWGNPQCRDACDFMLDTHMYLVLFYLQTTISPDARKWLQTEFNKIFSNYKNINPNPYYETFKKCLKEFEYYDSANLVYADSSTGSSLVSKVHYQSNKKMRRLDDQKLFKSIDKTEERRFDRGTRVNRGIFNEGFVSHLTLIV